MRLLVLFASDIGTGFTQLHLVDDFCSPVSSNLDRKDPVWLFGRFPRLNVDAQVTSRHWIVHASALPYERFAVDHRHVSPRTYAIENPV